MGCGLSGGPADTGNGGLSGQSGGGGAAGKTPGVGGLAGGYAGGGGAAGGSAGGAVVMQAPADRPGRRRQRRFGGGTGW